MHAKNVTESNLGGGYLLHLIVKLGVNVSMYILWREPLRYTQHPVRITCYTVLDTLNLALSENKLLRSFCFTVYVSCFLPSSYYLGF